MSVFCSEKTVSVFCSENTVFGMICRVGNVPKMDLYYHCLARE